MVDDLPGKIRKTPAPRSGGETEEQAQIEIEATLRAILFRAPDSPYVVGRFSSESLPESFTGTGDLIAPATGDTYLLEGSWVTHASYGRQFHFTSYSIVYPTTTEGIERYLASGLIRGVGRALAARIVRRFGEETINVLNGDIERLREVPGIGAKMLETIRESWETQRGVHVVMLFLKEHDVSTAYAVRIFRAYGRDTAAILRENPYRLIDDVDGIGFAIADRIAAKLGFAPTDMRRLLAGLHHLLSEAAEESGHTFVEREAVVAGAGARLGADEFKMREAIREAVERGVLIEEEERLYLPRFYLAEEAIAQAAARLFEMPRDPLDPRLLSGALRAVEAARGIEFSPLQVDAMHRSITEPVTVITGGPGTGKSTALIGILAAAESLGRRVALCAPTGRAAKRMTEVTGREARTIHRLLEFDPKGGFFQRNEENPVDADLIVADEASMIDTLLLAALFRAIPPASRIVFIGDQDQLPSVGAGQVLHDLIHCGQFPVVVLTTVFRQAEESMIVRNAHLIRGGDQPRFLKDCLFADCAETEEIPVRIEDLVRRRLPEKLDLDPLRDIQVLAPMHRTAAGVAHLNFILQRAMNPEGRLFLRRGDRAFRVGDKVMQTRNNYDKEVFNGDIGFISAADPEETLCTIQFDSRPVRYSFDEMEEVTLAYAITIHKSQGSEYPVVLIPMTLQHRIMLQRNLLYTGMTRAKKLLIFIGDKKAVRIAVATTHPSRRRTSLSERLARRLR